MAEKTVVTTVVTPLAFSAAIPTGGKASDRACRRCGLVKSATQFDTGGCDNCVNAFNGTTCEFSGLVSCMDPTTSWVAKWIGIGPLVPGCYAINVTK